MENNVVQFPNPPATRPAPPARDQMRLRAQASERRHAKAENIRVALNKTLAKDEARQIVRNLGSLIEEAGLRRSGGMADLIKRVGNDTLSKQRQRYVQFSDEPERPVARRGGPVFKRIAEVVAESSKPDDPMLAKDDAILRLANGIPRLQGNRIREQGAGRNAGEAYARLINFLNISVSEIVLDCRLVSYFQILTEDGLELDENCRFRAARTYEGAFSLTQIDDGQILMEAAARIPCFLPRVRVASLYRKHVATTVVVPDPLLSAEEMVDAESMYQAGLRRLGLSQGATVSLDDAYPSAPAGWERLDVGGVDTVFERLDVWLVIAPEGRAEAARPAFLFMSGQSETSDGDVWRSAGAFNHHANNCDLYYTEPMDGEDQNNPSLNSALAAVTKPLPAVLHFRENAEKIVLPASLYCGQEGTTSVLELRAKVPSRAPAVWHRTDGYGSLLQFLSPELESILFQSGYFYNNIDTDYRFSTLEPSSLNDTPVVIRHFIDPEDWSPGPMRSLGGALLRNLVGPPALSVLTALRQNAETLRGAMDDFIAQGREGFEQRYKLRMAAIEENGGTSDER